MTMLFDGFTKIKQVVNNKKKYECIVRPDSVCILLVEPQDNPMDDVITLGKQFRVGPYMRRGVEQSMSICAGYVDSGEDPFVAAGREAVEEFGAQGYLDYLGTYSVAPGTTTEVSHMFWMNVRVWDTPTDSSEGIEPFKVTLGEAITWIKAPPETLSGQLMMAIMLYARQRGVVV